jgi:WD repeat-containing protein 19
MFPSFPCVGLGHFPFFFFLLIFFFFFFLADVVAILTTAVVECQRAGLKKSALDFASVLVKPEYRNSIDANYKRKIEQLVRKPDKTEADETTSSCPNCGSDLPLTELDCPSCKNIIPYCVVTGRHMELSEWSSCPSCRFPALFTEFKKFATAEKVCPMCEQTINPASIVRDETPRVTLKKLLEMDASQTSKP